MPLDFQTPTPIMVDQVEVYPVKNKREVTNLTALFYIDAVKRGLRRNVLPVGTTQTEDDGLFQSAASGKNPELTQAFLKTFYIMLDEKLGLPEGDPNHLYEIIKRTLFDPISHDEKNRLVFNLSATPDLAARRFEKQLDEIGGIDLVLLGLGNNGHIGYNEKGSKLEDGARVVEFDEATIEQEKSHHQGEGPQATSGITLGPHNIWNAKEAMMMVSGAHKADALAATLYWGKQRVNECSAITLRHMAEDSKPVRIIADQAALSKCGL